MPGIITHNIIFFKSLNLLQRKNNRDTYSKSIESLFQTEDFKKAGLFGAIGPNIFDYLFIKKGNTYEYDISHNIHNGGSEKFLTSMLNNIINLRDYNNEWSATQRAYLYGFISHIISDCIFHPFILYWSGFPSSYEKKEIDYFREQHLLFEYNMDLFFIHFSDEVIVEFNLMDMLPLKSHRGFFKIDPAIKNILVRALKDTYPWKFYRTGWLNNKRNDLSRFNLGYLDLIPYLIELIYWIKRSNHPYMMKLIEAIKRKKLFYSNLLVTYPSPRKINRHVLNIHRERWFYPAGAKGLHYESALDLLRISCEKIVDIWKMIEALLYSNERDVIRITKEFAINAFTGEAEKAYRDMYLKNPIRLKF